MMKLNAWTILAGAVVGVGIGVAMGNVAIGLPVGMVIGVQMARGRAKKATPDA